MGGSSNEQVSSDGHQMLLVGGGGGWCPMSDVMGGFIVKSNASWAMGTHLPL